MTLKKKLATALFGLTLSVGMVACSSSDEGSNDKASEDKETTQEEKSSENNENTNGEVAAIVNGEEILMSRLDEAVNQQKQRAKQQGMELKDEQLNQMKGQILTQLINTEIVQQEAKASDISVSDEDVQAEYDKIVEQNGGEEQFNKLLEENDMTEKDLKEQLQSQLLIDQYLQANTEEVKVTDKEIQSQYDQIAKSSEGSEQEVPKLKDVKDQIKKTIKQQKEQQQQKKLIDNLKKDADIEKKV